MTETTETTAYVSLDEAAKLRGMAARTLRRRAAAGELTLYRDGVDRRRRLVRLGDLDAITRPRPVSRPAQEGRQLTPA